MDGAVAMRYIYACPCEYSACAIRKDKVFHCDTCGKVWSEEEIIKHQPKYDWHTADSDLYWELR